MKGAWVVLLLCASLAHAQEYADAEGEMARAAEYYRTGNYRAAIVHYGAAQKLAPDKPGPYLWLGLTHAALGECREAVPFLEKYMSLKTSDVKAEAMRTLAECKLKTTTVPGKLVVASTPAGAEVRLDAESGPPAGLTPYESNTVPTGAHVVFVSKSGFRTARGEVNVASGVVSHLTLPLEALPMLAPPPPEPRARRARPRYWIAGVVAGSVAAVALGVGLGVGLGLPRPTLLEPIGP